jgi:hypothetical protein
MKPRGEFGDNAEVLDDSISDTLQLIATVDCMRARARYLWNSIAPSTEPGYLT